MKTEEAYMIKPLEWRLHSDGEETAESPFGQFLVWLSSHNNRWACELWVNTSNYKRLGPSNGSESIEQAKAIAKSHYETKVKSCLLIPIPNQTEAERF